MVFEATASAAVIINEGVDAADVFVETTSFDTIGNAFYSRNDHCSLAGWRRLLVITSEFHLARTKAIFDWVYGPPARSLGGLTEKRSGSLSWHRETLRGLGSHGRGRGRGPKGARRRVDAKRGVEPWSRATESSPRSENF